MGGEAGVNGCEEVSFSALKPAYGAAVNRMQMNMQILL